MARLQLLQSRQLGSQVSYDERETDRHKFEFAKAYLYNVFMGRVRNEMFEVKTLLAHDQDAGFRLHPLVTKDIGQSGDMLVVDNSIQGMVLFLGDPYQVMVSTVREEYAFRIRYYVGVLGLSAESQNPSKLTQFILKESTQYSPYGNKNLLVEPANERGQVNIDITSVEIEKTDLSEVFLPDDTLESLRLFIDCVLRFGELNQPMRYLLSGKPGTAKTKIIRAIANEVQGKATVIFTNGSDDRIESVFTLAECFCPVIVCIDDVDLLVGTRERESQQQALGKFLQQLDGFTGSGTFVLATTNDKNLVDMAASRPGRFDLILDINLVDARHYYDLVKTKTKSEKVLSLFSEEIIDVLEAKKVSGAFIATLVRHLDVATQLGKRELDAEYVIKSINNMNKGFYKTPESLGEKPGFQLS